MKAILRFVKPIILVLASLGLIELMYFITPEANQLSGNLDRTLIIAIVYMICLILMYKAINFMFKFSKLGVIVLVVTLVTALIVWPSYKSFPQNPIITTNELYSLSLHSDIDISNSEIYIYNSDKGWVEVKKVTYDELINEENKQKRVVGIRIRNSNILDIMKLYSSGFYSIPILIPIKELK